MTFDDAYKIILEFEGGYVFDSNDPGGETKFGISKRSYPNCDIKNLTEEKAAAIYKLDYWDKVQAEKLNPAVRLLVFDCAINQGVSRAIKFLQTVAGVKADGVFGPITSRAIEDVTDPEFIAEYATLRMDYYARTPGWEHYGKGWSKRLLQISITSAFFVDFHIELD